MNFVETFKAGKEGKNVGLPTGIPKLDLAINGIQKKQSIAICAAPKVGKTTCADFIGVLSPFLHIEKLEKERVEAMGRTYSIWNEDKTALCWVTDINSLFHNIGWIYFSFEIDRISKEFKFASFFFATDYGIWNFTHKGKVYTMNQDYLMWRQMHKNEDDTLEVIPVIEEHQKILKEIYINRIIPIFGEYSDKGEKIRNGLVDILERADNPTGLSKYVKNYAERNGTMVTEPYTIREGGVDVHKTKVIGYKPNNPDRFTIIITDHVRKLKPEKELVTPKQKVDKWLEYSTDDRNLYGFTYIHIIHLNRELANIDRLKFAGEFIYPTGDDVKDTGNISEECTVIVTMFNPNDEKYMLEKHFGVKLREYPGAPTSLPNYRSLHVVEARYSSLAPAHISQNMYGGVNIFTDINTY